MKMFFANPGLAFGGAIIIAKYEIVRDVLRGTIKEPVGHVIPASGIWRSQGCSGADGQKGNVPCKGNRGIQRLG